MWWFCAYKLKVKGQIRQYKTTPKSHNSHVVIADMIGGDDDAAASKAKINFISWSMIGVQAGYNTQGAIDKTKKGLDLDNVSVGFKSYNKFAGNFLPNCPLYIEIALSESDLENYDGNQKVNYLYKKSTTNEVEVDFADGIRNFLCGIFANPVNYLAQSTKNNEGVNGETIPGPGSRPFLGHLKFGFNTPYVNFLTGFNYAKPDVRQAITWKTVTGNWDAGYNHVGGFNVFSLGSKAAAALEEATGLVWDIGFAPNKTADRKGTKYGYWGWAGVKNDSFAIDFQTNGMYDGEYLFTDPVEHDFIIGAKMPQIEVGDGKLNWALQALIATHQKEFKMVDPLNEDNDKKGDPNAIDYFGYSTDIWYRTTEMNNIAEKLAANVQVGYKAESFGVNLEYRMRGAQASMLYVRENHDDATFDLSDELGVANEQRIAFNGFVNCGDAATIDLGVKAKMPLIKYAADDELVVQSRAARPSWYVNRFDDNEALFYHGENGGVELFFEPAVTVKLSDNISLNAYGDMRFKAYTYMDGFNYLEKDKDGNYVKYDDSNNYSASDSSFLFKKGGISATIGFDNDFFKSVNVYAGVDNGDSIRMMETLVGQANFANDFVATLAFGVKHYKETDAKKKKIADEGVNNPFAFAVGVAKRFKAMKKPTVYAQFVYNMDPFKHFGDGQDQLNLDRANVKGSVEKEGAGNINAVDWYDGRAAVRVGVRWDI